MSQKVETAESLALPRLSAERRAAARDAWAAFWSSRAIVWAAGMAAILAFGWAGETSARLDPFFSTVPFTDAFSNLLVAPAARFDSAWYLAIAQHGYEVGGRSAFFPAFPGLVRIGGELSGSPLVAGIALSSACGLGGLYLLHRLVALDFGVERARTVVWLAAWFPGVGPQLRSARRGRAGAVERVPGSPGADRPGLRPLLGGLRSWRSDRADRHPRHRDGRLPRVGDLALHRGHPPAPSVLRGLCGLRARPTPLRPGR